MKSLLSSVLILAALAIASCGGGGSSSGPSFTGSGTVAGSDVQVIELIASSPQLPSDTTGLTTVTITAVAKDTNNNIVTGIPIIFSADSGSILILPQVTPPGGSGSGLVTAALSNGSDPSNRTITVTASDGNVTGTITVDVVGSTLVITGPASLASGDTGDYTIVLEDSNGIGIQGEAIAVTSANANTLSANTLTTGVDGDALVTMTADVGGNDTLTSVALGITATKAVVVSNDSFSFVVPASNVEIPLAAVQTVTVEWMVAGAPQVGQTINFSSTRGTLTAASAQTDAAGRATVTISSTNAGPAVITASNPNGTTTTVNVEFTASVAQSINVQASPFTVASGEQSEILAIVRDPNGNLVKNKLVTFQLIDITNGFLSVGSGVTDSTGKAQTFYTGGSVPSAQNGVTVTASVVEGATTITNTVALTVARAEVAISIGTSDVLFLPDAARYAQLWVMLATDTVGNPIANTTIQASLRSVRYYKGDLQLVMGTTGSFTWKQFVSTLPGEPFCADEDTNRDGFLDLINEDFNGNGSLEAGNVATVFAVPDTADPDNPCALVAGGSVSTDVVTDAQGFARVCVIYPRSVNLWADVELTGQLNVFGSEFSSKQEFRLSALAADLNDAASDPAGRVSPFGTATTCANPL
jgi:hypothetical protein